MPKKLTWTAAQDSQIRRLRTEGASWDTISTILGLARWTVIERGRRIKALRPPRDFVHLPMIRLVIPCQPGIRAAGA
jgi:hypothetical protein